MLYSKQTPAAGGTAFAQFDAAWCYDGNGYILNDTGTSLDVRIGASGSVQTLASGATLPIKLVFSMAELYVRRTDQSTTQVTVEATVGTGSAGGGGSTADMAVIASAATAAHATDPAAHGNGYEFAKLMLGRKSITCIGHGDSIMVGNVSPVFYPNFVSQTSWLHQLAAITGRLQILRRCAIPGQNSTQVAARFAADVAAYSPQVVFIGAGTNDALYNDADVALATTLANDAAMIRAARAAGIVPVLCSLLPVSYSGFEAKAAVCATINAAKAALARNLAVDYIDLWTPVYDASRNGLFSESLSDDGLHPNTAGAIAIANAINATFRMSDIATPTFLPVLSGDGGLVANPLFADSNSDGLPDGWVLGAGAGTLSCTAGAVGNVFRITKGAGQTVGYSSYQTAHALAKGDSFELAFRYRIVSTSGTLAPVFQFVVSNCSTDSTCRPVYVPAGTTQSDSSGVICLRGQVDPAATGEGNYIWFDINMGATGAGYVEISQLRIAKL